MKHYSYHDLAPRGTIERVRYTTRNTTGETCEKYANVYLPYCYDAADTAKRYNILYLMHGGGGNADAWLDSSPMKNMLDYAFANGEAEPMIVVFPSFYKADTTRIGGPSRDVEHARVLEFMPELTEDLLPAVESLYNVCASDGSDASLRASRAHRAFGGFSMGSCVTWYAFLKKLDYFGTFLPLSGDCWAVEPMGGASHPEETAKILRDAAAAYAEWNVFCATGTKDLAYTALKPMIEAMRKHTDVFTEENLHFAVAEDYEHCYEAVTDYVYNFLPHLFK